MKTSIDGLWWRVKSFVTERVTLFFARERNSCTGLLTNKAGVCIPSWVQEILFERIRQVRLVGKIHGFCLWIKTCTAECSLKMTAFPLLDELVSFINRCWWVARKWGKPSKGEERSSRKLGIHNWIVVMARGWFGVVFFFQGEMILTGCQRLNGQREYYRCRSTRHYRFNSSEIIFFIDRCIIMETFQVVCMGWLLLRVGWLVTQSGRLSQQYGFLSGFRYQGTDNKSLGSELFYVQYCRCVCVNNSHVCCVIGWGRRTGVVNFQSGGECKHSCEKSLIENV